MQKFVDRLIEKKQIFKSLKEFDLKTIAVRKKIDVFIGVDTKSYYTLVVFIEQKSRFLQKNVDEMEKIVDLIKVKEDHNFKRKIILIDSPLCSKAKAKLKDLNWKVYDR